MCAYFYSWVAILALNTILLSVLVAHRKQNHPLLALFFCINVGIDLCMFVLCRKGAGGLGVVDTTELNRAGLAYWYASAEFLWLSWFLMVFWCAVALNFEFRKYRKWLCLSLVLVATACLAWSFLIQFDVMSKATKRYFMHMIIEPALLLGAITQLAYYVKERMKRDEPLNIVCLAIAMIVLVLALRVVIALRPDLVMIRNVSHTIYFTSYAAFSISYFVNRRGQSWQLA